MDNENLENTRQKINTRLKEREPRGRGPSKSSGSESDMSESKTQTRRVGPTTSAIPIQLANSNEVRGSRPTGLYGSLPTTSAHYSHMLSMSLSTSLSRNLGGRSGLAALPQQANPRQRANNIRARYLQKLRIPTHKGKETPPDAQVEVSPLQKHSRPMKIQTRGWAHRRGRRKTSAPQRPSPSMLAKHVDTAKVETREVSPLHLDLNELQLDESLMFGEESPAPTRDRSQSTSSLYLEYELDDDINLERLPPNSLPTRSRFIPPHELATTKAAGTVATDSTEDDMMFTAESSPSDM